MFDEQGFAAINGDARTVREALHGEDNGVLEGIRETDNGVRESANQGDMSADAHKSSTELARHFGVTKDSIQDWYKVILQAYYWMPVSEFKVGKGKNTQYTPFCIAAMTELKAARESGQTSVDWIAAIHDSNAERLQQYQPETQQVKQEQVVEGEIQQPTPIEGEFVLDPGVLALYNQAQQQSEQKPTGNTGLSLFFKPDDYQNRYQSAANQLSTQVNREVNFANELLAKCAEMTVDNRAWNQAEQQKQDANQRQAAIRGMERALNEFMNENAAYRGLKAQLENGEVTPEQVIALMARLRNTQQPEGNAQAPNGSGVAS